MGAHTSSSYVCGRCRAWPSDTQWLSCRYVWAPGVMALIRRARSRRRAASPRQPNSDTAGLLAPARRRLDHAPRLRQGVRERDRAEAGRAAGRRAPGVRGVAHAAVPPHDHHPSSLPSRGIRDAPPSRRLGPTRYMVHKAMQEKIAAITRAEGEAEAARIISTALTKSGAGLVEVRGGALAPLPPPPLPPSASASNPRSPSIESSSLVAQCRRRAWRAALAARVV